MDKKWYANSTVSPYTRHLDEMIKSSNKFTQIQVEVLSKMKDDEKLIVMPSFPAITFIAYLVNLQFPLNTMVVAVLSLTRWVIAKS